MSAAGLIVRFLILVVVVPVLFWSLLIIVELQLKSGVPLPGLRDSSITENDAYEPSGVFAPPASVGMVQVNVFVVLSNVSVPGCIRLYDITLNAFPICIFGYYIGCCCCTEVVYLCKHNYLLFIIIGINASIPRIISHIKIDWIGSSIQNQTVCVVCCVPVIFCFC